jgi:hypothetical protein
MIGDCCWEIHTLLRELANILNLVVELGLVEAYFLRYVFFLVSRSTRANRDKDLTFIVFINEVGNSEFAIQLTRDAKACPTVRIGGKCFCYLMYPG